MSTDDFTVSLNHLSPWEKTHLLSTTVLDEEADLAVRKRAIQALGRSDDMFGTHALRKLLHSADTDISLRILALDSITAHDLFHVDLLALILNPAVPVGLKAEATEKSAGCPELAPFLMKFLEDGTEPPEILFWTLYALGSIYAGDESATDVKALVERYLEDERVVVVVPPTSGTIAQEADWAKRTIEGENIDPEWMSSFRHVTP